jgi:DNA segregation ATPase FtsK/SpoIIIE, S-DNA-T family
MASSQKKSTSPRPSSSSGSRGSSNGKSGGKRMTQSGGKSRGSSRKPAQPQKKPYRREIGAVICLLLAFFSAIGYFKTDDGAFITLFCNLLKGLCGYGFYIAPPMLLITAWILAFHRGRPVRLRVTSALLLPMLTGAVFHLILCRAEYTWSAALLGQLWMDGLTCTSGGAVSGLLAVTFRYAFSKVGALAVFVVLAVVAVFCTFHITPSDILDFFREKKENRPEYDPDDYEEPVRPVRREPEKPAHTGRKPVIDIPVDDGPLTAKEPTTPVTTVRKKKLFDRFAGVPSPDKVLTGDTTPEAEPEKPQYENVPDLTPATDGTFRPTSVNSEPVPAAKPAPQAETTAQPDVPVPPPIIQEPAVHKVTKDEAQQANNEVSREIEQSMAEEPPAYRYPPLSLLKEGTGSTGGEALSELHTNQQRLEDTLRSFGVDARISGVTRGPSVTRYELALEQGVKLNKITNLSDDIALALGASAVRIAPIPDKISTVGIEVPNRSVTSVAIREVIGSKAFTDSTSKVSFAVGKDIAGNCIVGNIAKLPHMLIAGTTGSGKSVCTNSLIISLLYKSTPEEVRLIMVDPKMVELGVYNGIPHLLIPVVTDPKKAAGALQWAVNEMMKRYRAFSEVGAKDLASYNNHARKEGKEPMPQIVVVIDELADLMLVAAKEVEESICRVAQMGRASGMHLVIATQRPSADVITGLMKANIPSRIAFAVASSLESRIILDTTGAEKLVGKGDMLYFPLGSGKPQRVQGCFISEEEVAAVVDFIKEGSAARYDESVIHEIEQHAEEKEKASKGVGGSDPSDGGDYDELLPAAIEVVLEVGQASVSMLQRRLKLGYGRAARLVDQMEEKGVVGPFEGSKPRQLLITKEQWQEMQFKQGMVDKAPEPVYSEPVPEEFPYEGDAVEQRRDAPPFDP